MLLCSGGVGEWRSDVMPAQVLVDEALRRLRILAERNEHAADGLDAIGQRERAESLRIAAGVARDWIRDIEEARP